MDAKLLKLDDLEIDQSYFVVAYRPINSKYGDTYIIKCTLTGFEEQQEFEMFATKLIASYISTYSPKEKFIFKVRKNSKYTYAEISGYIPSASFIQLK